MGDWTQNHEAELVEWMEGEELPEDCVPVEFEDDEPCDHTLERQEMEDFEQADEYFGGGYYDEFDSYGEY